MGSLSPPVSWRGLTADYTRDERQLMRDLPVKEQFAVHVLKAFTDGEIADVREGHSSANQSANHGTVRPADEVAVGESAATASRPGSNDPIGGSGLTVYTDPEDIPFGPEPRRKKVYAVVWTPGRHRRCKTKDGDKDRRSAMRTIRTWHRWYVRRGWRIIAGSQDAGWYIAANEKKGDRVAISLHEYDRETKERLA